MSVSAMVVVLVASAVAMLVKSVTGLGYPLLAIPIIAAVTGVENAVVAVSIPNVTANVLLAWRSRHARRETRDLLSLSITAAAGAAAGTLLLVTLPEKPLLAMLIAMLVLFLIRSMLLSGYRVSAAVARRASPAVGFAAGVMHGSVGVSGPVVAAWLFAYRLHRDAYIFSLSLLFLMGGIAQIAVLASIGAYDGDHLTAAAVALGPVLAVLPAGERLRARLSGVAFDRAILAVLAVAAVVLAGRAFSS